MIPVKVSASTPVLDREKIPDGDYTADFLEAGTTLNASGEEWTIIGPVPVTRAWVKGGVLFVEGDAWGTSDDAWSVTVEGTVDPDCWPGA